MIEGRPAKLVIQISQNRELRVDHLQSRILPRLVQDTIHCLWLAHDHVDHDLKSATRRMIMSLRKADVSDARTALFMFQELSPHLLRVEGTLEAMERPCTAKSVRRVRDRVEHLASQANAATHASLASLGTPDPAAEQFRDSGVGPDV